jgi:hypothetical protein
MPEPLDHSGYSTWADVTRTHHLDVPIRSLKLETRVRLSVSQVGNSGSNPGKIKLHWHWRDHRSTTRAYVVGQVR